jgi:phosphohistidine phosphatase
VRTLYLLRHATATSGGPSGDASRPLSPEGEKEAEAMGRFMAAARLEPSTAACSSAVRTRQTAAGILRGLGSKHEAKAADELYNATGAELLAWLQQNGGRSAQLLLVAHMPGVGELTSLLCTESNDFATAFAPATLAVITGEAQWADWDYGRGSLQLLMPVGHVPRG